MSRLTDQELEWIKNRYSNAGTSQCPSAVDRCLFLSVGAKQLYHSLCQYAYGSKKICNPSQARLMLELNIAPGTLARCLNELRESGLVSTTQASYRTMNYILEEITEPFCLNHSEWIWKLIEAVRKVRTVSYKQEKKVIDEYRRSELCREIVSSFNGKEHVQLLYDWFGGRLGVRPVVTFDDWKVTLQLEDEEVNKADRPFEVRYVSQPLHLSTADIASKAGWDFL